MKTKEIITQLESIREDSNGHIEASDYADVWKDDVIALSHAIRLFKQKERRKKNTIGKFLFSVNIAALTILFFIGLGLIGGFETGILNGQQFMSKMSLVIILLVVSAVGFVILWRGVKEEC